MDEDQKIYEALVAHVKTAEGGQIRFKDESLFMKTLGVLVWAFNRTFMTQYTSTIRKTVYFPSRKWLEENYRLAWKVLAHEYVHIFDKRRLRGRYGISYLAPQIGAFFGFGLCLILWLDAQYWVPFILLLAPIPAYWRMKLELRGYTMSMAINGWRHGSVRDYQIAFIAEQFTSSAYYFMWPFEDAITKKLIQMAAAVEGDVILEGEINEPYREVRALLVREGAVNG
jgi:hypothetical protein